MISSNGSECFWKPPFSLVINVFWQRLSTISCSSPLFQRAHLSKSRFLVICCVTSSGVSTVVVAQAGRWSEELIRADANAVRTHQRGFLKVSRLLDWLWSKTRRRFCLNFCFLPHFHSPFLPQSHWSICIRRSRATGCSLKSWGFCSAKERTRSDKLEDGCGNNSSTQIHYLDICGNVFHSALFILNFFLPLSYVPDGWIWRKWENCLFPFFSFLLRQLRWNINKSER